MLVPSVAFAQQMTVIGAPEVAGSCLVSWHQDTLTLINRAFRTHWGTALLHQTSTGELIGQSIGGTLFGAGGIVLKPDSDRSGWDITFAFWMCQKIQAAGTDGTSTSYVLTTGHPGWSGFPDLEPGASYPVDVKGDKVEVRGLFQFSKNTWTTRIYPPQTKKVHGMRGPHTFKYEIVATCKEGNCLTPDGMSCSLKDNPPTRRGQN